jgi:CspA family cold shock protein
MTERQEGLVKAWRDDKGYGFVKPNAGGIDVFIHVSNVRDQQPLSRGDRVTFVLGVNRTSGKSEAQQVELIDDTSHLADEVFGGGLDRTLQR